MNSIELGKFLASLRNEKELTQEELAEKLYIDKRKVSRWECGTSIPDFETLIKLSEILDVSLYELSICKRLDKEKISTKAINKLKGIKDYKKLKLRKKLLIILLIILGICFIITTTYTLKNSGTVEIYEFESLDKDYNIVGNYIKAKEYGIFNIHYIEYINEKSNGNNGLNKCNFEIYKDGNRILYGDNINNKSFYYIKTFNSINILNEVFLKNKEYILKANCSNEINNPENISFKFKLNKKYDNKLF